MLKGAHTYNWLSWVLLDFPTSALAVAYELQVPPSLSFSRQRCTSTLGGSEPAMRRLSLAGARSACERERPCHTVGHPDAAGLISFFQTPLQLWCHVRVPRPADKAPSSHWQTQKVRERVGRPQSKGRSASSGRYYYEGKQPLASPSYTLGVMDDLQLQVYLTPPVPEKYAATSFEIFKGWLVRTKWLAAIVVRVDRDKAPGHH